MNANYLQELINEARSREGGLVLQENGQAAAVVMTVEKYNELLLQKEKISSAKFQPHTATEPADYHSNNNKIILITGGAGYIGSHAARELLKAGYEVVVVDNLSSGKRQHVPPGARFIEGDIGNSAVLRSVFASEKIYAVMHFAASLEVEESVREPQKYFRNNALNTAVLLETMTEAGVRNLIFSSTAAVYGNQEATLLSEHAKLQPDNPYGYSKLLAERMIKYYSYFCGLQAVIFRYFNACGCDFDGTVKPTHNSHLIPIVMEAAAGERPALKVYGNDYPTPDGTCLRDYVHVLDIAHAHVLALEKIAGVAACRIYNIGTGSGRSVLEVVEKAEQVLHKKIPVMIAPRRAGDAARSVADNTKIREELGFELEFSDLETIIKTAWHQMGYSARS